MEKSLYHRSYELLQPLGFVGKWELSKKQHLETISAAFPDNKDLTVLYVGTATARNPIDVKKALESLGYSLDLTVIDISDRPLDKTNVKNLSIRTIKTDACDMKSIDGEFDVITTDFLLNMCPFERSAAIVRELARVLSRQGVITMTVFTEENAPKKMKSFLISHLANKYFASEEQWRRVFEKSGLTLDIKKFNPSKKPFLYHTDQFSQFIARRT